MRPGHDRRAAGREPAGVVPGHPRDSSRVRLGRHSVVRNVAKWVKPRAAGDRLAQGIPNGRHGRQAVAVSEVDRHRERLVQQLALLRACGERSPDVPLEIRRPLGRQPPPPHALEVVKQQLRYQEERSPRGLDLVPVRVMIEQRAAEGTGTEVIHDHHLPGREAPASSCRWIQHLVHGLELEEVIAAEVETHLGAAEPGPQERGRNHLVEGRIGARHVHAASVFEAVEHRAIECVALEQGRRALDHHAAQLRGRDAVAIRVEERLGRVGVDAREEGGHPIGRHLLRRETRADQAHPVVDRHRGELRHQRVPSLDRDAGRNLHVLLPVDVGQGDDLLHVRQIGEPLERGVDRGIHRLLERHDGELLAGHAAAFDRPAHRFALGAE